MAKSLSCSCLLRQAPMTATYSTYNLGSAQRGEQLRPPGANHQGGLTSIKVVVPTKRGNNSVGLEAIKTDVTAFSSSRKCVSGVRHYCPAGQTSSDIAL